MSKPISKVAEVRVPGPLAPFAAGFKSALQQAGYTPLSAVVQLRLMVHLSHWLEGRGLSVRDLTAERIETYLASRRAAGRALNTSRGLSPLLDYLASQQMLPDQEPTPSPSGAQALLASFDNYLRTERGLAASTRSDYLTRVARFLADYAADGDLAAVTPADIVRAVQAEGVTRSVGAVQYFVVALRSFLRFGHLQGLISEDLSAAALAVTGRRPSLLPQGISDKDAAALLRSCDRRQRIGRRDYAVLLMLLRLGLRAGEVARLRLEDIDWRAGQIKILGKGQRLERLPLPIDVGEAIVGYLRRGRPATPWREVFVTAIAPVRPLTRGSVSLIVRRACVRVGVLPVGAHRLRHTMACAMVRAEVPLPQIGQVLRHRSPISTAGYARVDLPQLAALARPWPARAGGER